VIKQKKVTDNTQLVSITVFTSYITFLEKLVYNSSNKNAQKTAISGLNVFKSVTTE